jgi:amino acid adenylation domain-containing protein
MWFFEQLRPGSAVYHIPIVLRLTGPLHVAALASAFQALIDRHPSLRTGVQTVDGVPAARLFAEPPKPLLEIDLSAYPAREREDELHARVTAEIRRPFDLTQEPPLRCALFRLAAEVRVLAITVHHIASDLWSGQILLRELGVLYDAAAAGQPAALPALPIRYGDYAAWERSWLEGSAPGEHLDYWARQLAGAPGRLDLPTDAPRAPEACFDGALARAAIPSELADELQALSRAQGVTLFMTLLAAWHVLLGRLSRQDDVVVGIPTAGRTLPATEGVVGLFVNTLAIRADLSADPLFRAFLQQVKDTTLAALSHQEVPFDRVVERVRPPREGGEAPLVQVMFTLQHSAEAGLALPGIAAEPVPVDPGVSRLDLTLVATPAAAGLELVLEYRTDLFLRETAERLLGRFAALLEEVAADPDRPLSKLPILAAGERQRLLVEWNRTEQVFAGPACLHQLVECQARATPNREAVVAGESRLTYAQLDAEADRIARRLAAAGAGAECRVGVLLSRGPRLIPALLGVLKSGAAYVPLDPSYPAERLDYMLDDSRASVLLTETARAGSLPGFCGRVVCVEDQGGDAPLPAPEARTGSQLAYVIYTSGSTGQPKGVAIEHRNAVAFVRWAHTVFSAAEMEGVLAATSAAFDLSVFEIFAPLSCGGKVIVAENALALAELPARGEVRLLNTVPSAAAELVRSGAIPESITTINLAGEPLAQELADRLYALPQVRRVYDLYGPSETTTYSTFALRAPGGRPTIGRPIANTMLYLLDRHLQPVPLGTIGELFIGGAGVARGYLNRPALTAERFIRNPFVVDPQARLYRTGDLCRYRADGSLEYHGRCDHQVKIRGFRVETGEVEAALRAHPAVADVCVAAREDAPGERRLVAYLVAQGALPSPAEWRGRLQARLPEAFIPSAFVTLPELPRTANGKVDRAALPAPPDRAAAVAAPVPPRDPLERQLARIWEQILGTAPIGVTDRFFDLGGHSLLAVRLTVQIERQLGRKLSLAALLQAPTIAELAQRLRAEAPEPRAPAGSLVALNAEGSRPPLFLVHGMGGGVLWGYTNLTRHLDPDQPVFGFQADEARLPAAPESLESLARRYVAELRLRQPRGPYRLGGYCFGGNLAYEMACQLEAAGERVDKLLLISAWPANSGHDRMRWTPGGIAAFFANLARWMLRFREWAPQARAQFFRWKLASLRQRLLRRLRPPRAGAPDREIELLVDLSEIPDGERRLWAAHLRALRGYHPRPYGGAVTLLRTRAYPMFCSFDPSHGWSDLARGGVAVRRLPGRHSTILSEPDVAALAREIEAELRGPASARGGS